MVALEHDGSVNRRRLKIVAFLVLLVFVVSVYFYKSQRDDDMKEDTWSPVFYDEPENDRKLSRQNYTLGDDDDELKIRATDGHKLGVIVPYRAASKELNEFAPHMKKFLENQNIRYEIFIVNQVDEYRFNRGQLLNIGFREAIKSGCDYIALHDVDLLPLNDKLDYSYPEMPMHISAPHLHPIYRYKEFVGGILLLNAKQFKQINGLSIRYWGWGKEDDELNRRMKENNMRIERPPKDIGTGPKNTFWHVHDGNERVRDRIKVGSQALEDQKRDIVTGLSTTTLDTYSLLEKHSESIRGSEVTFLDVELKCNQLLTPWCVPPKECGEGYFKKKITDETMPRWVCQKCEYAGCMDLHLQHNIFTFVTVLAILVFVYIEFKLRQNGSSCIHVCKRLLLFIQYRLFL
eukprot:m.65459 g.65459  ORF g.65459 m.65459 type:complete len:404 (+) comp8153_c0_seq3:84-1295(+)